MTINAEDYYLHSNMSLLLQFSALINYCLLRITVATVYYCTVARICTVASDTVAIDPIHPSPNQGLWSAPNALHCSSLQLPITTAEDPCLECGGLEETRLQTVASLVAEKGPKAN